MGTFLAYPHMQYNDDMFKKPVDFGDWLYFHDRINRCVYGADQHGAIAEYYGYTALAAHEMFSNINNNRGFPSIVLHGQRPKMANLFLQKHPFRA